MAWLLCSMIHALLVSQSCLDLLPEARPEPARLSRASTSSGKAFNLDSLRARDMIVTRVEALENVITPLLRATAAGLPKMLSNPLFVLGHRLPVRLISRC